MLVDGERARRGALQRFSAAVFALLGAAVVLAGVLAVNIYETEPFRQQHHIQAQHLAGVARAKVRLA